MGTFVGETLHVLGFCNSSIRYKTNVQPFSAGLNLINRLRPVSFNWKSNHDADFGLIAEEVADVEPLLVTRDGKGQIQGVKYERLGVALINAVRELKAEKDAQVSALKLESAAWQKQIAALKSDRASSSELCDRCSPIRY